MPGGATDGDLFLKDTASSEILLLPGPAQMCIKVSMQRNIVMGISV